MDSFADGVYDFLADTEIFTLDPYCEACRRWLRKRKLFYEFQAENPDALLNALKESDYGALEQAPALPRGRKPDDYFKVKIYACEDCGKEAYLTLRSRRKITFKGFRQGESAKQDVFARKRPSLPIRRRIKTLNVILRRALIAQAGHPGV